jgi:hypothetical protein
VRGVCANREGFAKSPQYPARPTRSAGPASSICTLPGGESGLYASHFSRLIQWTMPRLVQASIVQSKVVWATMKAVVDCNNRFSSTPHPHPLPQEERECAARLIVTVH